MDPVQSYETTLVDRDAFDESYTFLSVPSHAFPNAPRHLWPRIRWFADQLDMQQGRPLLGTGRFVIPGAVANGVLFTLAGASAAQDVREGQRRAREDLEEWAQYLANEAKIPFESSPLAGQSLNQIVGKATGGVAAMLTALASGHPVLMVITPAGYVLGGITAALGDVAYHSTRYHLYRLLHVPPEEYRPPERET